MERGACKHIVIAGQRGVRTSGTTRGESPCIRPLCALCSVDPSHPVPHVSLSCRSSTKRVLRVSYAMPSLQATHANGKNCKSCGGAPQNEMKASQICIKRKAAIVALIANSRNAAWPASSCPAEWCGGRQVPISEQSVQAAKAVKSAGPSFCRTHRPRANPSAPMHPSAPHA